MYKLTAGRGGLVFSSVGGAGGRGFRGRTMSSMSLLAAGATRSTKVKRQSSKQVRSLLAL
jgi:hypothetical protein